MPSSEAWWQAYNRHSRLCAGFLASYLDGREWAFDLAKREARKAMRAQEEWDGRQLREDPELVGILRSAGVVVAFGLALLLPACFSDPGDNGGPTTLETTSDSTTSATGSDTTTAPVDSSTGADTTSTGADTTSTGAACHPECGDNTDCDGGDACLETELGLRCYPAGCANCFWDGLDCCTNPMCGYVGCGPCG